MRNTVITFLFFCALFLCSCRPHEPQYRSGVSQCLDDAWRRKMNEEMERELLLHPELGLSRRVAYGSSALQCEQIDSFITERVDLLIVSPNVAEEVKPAVTRAYRAGIPVIVADRRVSGDQWTAFIGGDNYHVGELMAEWVLSLQRGTPHALHVLEVLGLPGSTPTALRHKGMTDRLAERQDTSLHMASVSGRWYREDAYQAVAEYLATHPDVDVIVAQNDLMAIGASEAVRDARDYREGQVHIMGVDGIMLGLQAVLDKKIECTVTYSSRGDLIIETAARILGKEPFVRDTVLETAIIDAESARAISMQYRERMHDLETLRIVQVNSDLQWRKSRIDRTILICILGLVLVAFFFALWFLYFKQQDLQREIKKEIIPQLENVQETILLNKRDEAFAERMKQIVEEHLTDPDLNVESLGSMLQLSRTQLFRRVKAITGKGPLDYIRERRLVRADQLLHTTDMTVQQVSIELCFSSPSYFAKCYKEHFGHLPSKPE